MILNDWYTWWAWLRVQYCESWKRITTKARKLHSRNLSVLKSRCKIKKQSVIWFGICFSFRAWKVSKILRLLNLQSLQLLWIICILLIRSFVLHTVLNRRKTGSESSNPTLAPTVVNEWCVHGFSIDILS